MTGPLAFDAVVIATLAAILVLSELARAYGIPASRPWLRVMRYAIAPLLVVFAITVVIRILDLPSFAGGD